MIYSDHAQALQRVLRGRLLTAAELGSLLGVSQATISRGVRDCADRVVMVRRPGVRAPQYALLRNDLPIAPRQQLFRLDAEGRAAQIGEVLLLDGGATFVDCTHPDCRALGGYFEGLPPWLRTMMPSGFVGRGLVQRHHQRLQLPASLRDWGDDHHLVFLTDSGHDTPGDLVLGAQALSRAVEVFEPSPARTEEERGTLYRDRVLAQADETGGASAGGEQPKFLVNLAGGPSLLVKYARCQTRWADLLACEHIALGLLAGQGMPAAATRAFDAHGMRFLEVERFDRVGRQGRKPFVSAAAVDDELFGKRDTWTAFAKRCAGRALITDEDARRIELLSAFGVLIGNNDMHFENLGLVPDHGRGNFELSPAYDMLPMRYAPIAGGIDPELVPINPSFADGGVSLAAWAQAIPWAISFWDEVSREHRVSDGMRALASLNAEVLRSRLARIAPQP